MSSTELCRFHFSVQILIAITNLILNHRELGLLEEASTKCPYIERVKKW
jgi:hypothetical protein